MPEKDTNPPLNIAGALTLLLICQLAGEVLVTTAHQFFAGFAFPGPVAGMALLFLVLVWRKGPGSALDTTANTILRNLSLLFVPAAVGVVQYGDTLLQFGLPLLVALAGSTLLTLLVTVGVFIAIMGNKGVDQP